MEKTRTKAFLVRGFLLAALLIGAWAVRSWTGVKNSDEAGVAMSAGGDILLPSTVGAWQGSIVLNCASRTCGRSWAVNELPPGTTACPACGSELRSMNHAEFDMLPRDTKLVRACYLRREPPLLPIWTSIVLSGNDRTSIHRPQVCMTANGYEIDAERVFSVDLGPGRKPLELTVLDMTHPADARHPSPHHIFYAYWFIGKNRLCATHWQRMWWMAYDRIVHGVNHRWAYVAVSGARTPGSDAHLQTLANFASQLHPQILGPDFSDLDDPQGNNEP